MQPCGWPVAPSHVPDGHRATRRCPSQPATLMVEPEHHRGGRTFEQATASRGDVEQLDAASPSVAGGWTARCGAVRAGTQARQAAVHHGQSAARAEGHPRQGEAVEPGVLEGQPAVDGWVAATDRFAGGQTPEVDGRWQRSLVGHGIETTVDADCADVS